MQKLQHAIDQKTITMYVVVIIAVVVLFEVLASLYPTLTASGQVLNDSGFPLGELFVSGGAIWFVLAGAVIYLLITSFMKNK